jgi:isoleucyl-tRNA synthetase
MKAPLDLKSTVNLPKTDFPMKANLPWREPEMLKRWDEERLYQRLRQLGAGRPHFVLHDGPPYANDNIHLGTTLNKLVKDFIVKSKSMAGFDAPYLPGWDCHGLPIEIKVDKELGGRKKTMSPLEIRAACRRYAEKYVKLQREDFKRLGVLGEWETPYLTMSADYQATIAGAFLTFLEKGYVYKGQRPVNWCIYCETALAEAEVEYEDHASPSIWVSYAQSEGTQERLGPGAYAIIWTTTPWTLPASMALTVHADFDYVVREASDGRAYLFASALADEIAAQTGLKWGAERAAFQGRELAGLKFRHPFVDREVPMIVGPHVTLEQGSGIVHTAPGHGYEDYVVGQQHGIPIYCPVDGTGTFTAEAGEVAGLQVFEANPVIVEIVKRHGALLAAEKLTHSYPHCWRCHNPTIFRATEQWFIGMERNELRRRALEEVKKVRWSPGWGEDRIFNMIANRPDWCISRQRAWGVPIVMFYCQGCDERLADMAALRYTVSLFAKETADVWYSRPVKELLPAGTRCAKCGGSDFRKEDDILDVWFDSGSSHLAVLGHRPDLPWPADEYLEGPDQYRGWFHSSLLVGIGIRDGSPYRSVATAGWTLDAQGRAMSKSLGNVIAPQEVWKKYGAEVLRLWVASADFREDTRISDEILTRLSEAYRKIRNTFRFALSNLYDFSIERNAVPVAEMLEVDRWALARTAELVERCRAWYEEQVFHRVYHAAYDFCTVDLSSFYFDVLKDRLYTSAPKSQARRSAQTAFYRLLDALLRLLAPILSFTCDEAWRYLAKPAGRPESVHLALLPSPQDLRAGISAEEMEQLKAWDRLFVVRSQVLKALEEARNEKVIGSGLEARIRLSADPQWRELLERYGAQLPTLFIVSQVELADGLPGGRTFDVPGIRVAVERAGGKKCERCWNFSEHIGENKEYPTVCERCAPVLEEIAADR